MAKKDWKNEEITQPEEMTLEEAKAYRASLHKPEIKSFSEKELREEFRKFWAQEKYKYGKGKELEPILWLHMKATKQTKPEQFEGALAHFGLKKVK